ncbi:hypothetical protein BB558_006851 [Smittium angustum]|uniref:Peptidase A2 domain-containing protein n=1 Tax=Smittium angustum TaxID=133377 RepID=A0A2U1IWL7_SMIAN|nr:hypothetical protein BB558_006851 [Smittium angustum]
MDTGAACSVISSSMMHELGVQCDTPSNQIIVTADGSKHSTLGKVSAIPIKVAGYSFGVDLLVMEKQKNTLILGIDWFWKHRATIDIHNEELILPVEDYDVILSLSTRGDGRGRGLSETEMFALIKEVKTVENKSLDEGQSKIQELIEEYSEIFVDDPMDLRQTNVIEHSIDTESSENEINIIEQELVNINVMDIYYHEAIKDYLREFRYPNGADDQFRKKLRDKARLYRLIEGTLYKNSKSYGLREVLNERNCDRKIMEIHEETHEGINNTWQRVKNKFVGSALFKVRNMPKIQPKNSKKQPTDSNHSPKAISDTGNRRSWTNITHFCQR